MLTVLSSRNEECHNRPQPLLSRLVPTFWVRAVHQLQPTVNLGVDPDKRSCGCVPYRYLDKLKEWRYRPKVLVNRVLLFRLHVLKILEQSVQCVSVKVVGDNQFLLYFQKDPRAPLLSEDGGQPSSQSQCIVLFVYLTLHNTTGRNLVC